MKRTGLQSCLSGKSPQKDPEKAAKSHESPVIRNSPNWPADSSAEAKAVAELWASCCSRRQHGKGMENDLCLQRSPKPHFSWAQESGLASRHPLFSVSLHPRLPFRLPQPGVSWMPLPGRVLPWLAALPERRGVSPCHRAISSGCLLRHRDRSCWHRCSTRAKIGLVTLNTLDNKSSL